MAYVWGLRAAKRIAAAITIDERLEKLTERHEALTETIQLRAHENRERDAAWKERSAELDKRFSAIADALEHLSHIADSHNARLDELKGTA